jgi:hypothetical protein
MNPVQRIASLATVGLLVAACGESSMPTSSLSPRGTATLGGEVSVPKVMTLCKFGPEGTSATFSISSTGAGFLPEGTSVTLQASQNDAVLSCRDIWKSVSPGDASTVTVTETDMTPGTELDRIIYWDASGLNELEGTNTVSLNVDFDNGALVWFKNVVGDEPPPPPPPTGVAGCTPGFWRQPHHYQYWAAPYTPTTAFGSVFSNAFPGRNLGQIVQANGGGLNALGRHTVAALLNAASPEVEYGMTPAQVIEAFNAAYASGNYEAQKNVFEGYNERGCTVDKSR